MKLGILARVSTDEQRKGQTIQSQVSELEHYAQKNNWIICDRFLDEGWSGELEHRPALDRLNEAILAKEIDSVLMYHPDRLSRNLIQQLLLQQNYEKQGVKIIFTSQPNMEDQSPESRLITKTIVAMNSELDKMRITDRFRMGKLRKARSGHVITGQAPYGYRYVKGDKDRGIEGHFIINLDEIETAKLILSWGKEGKSQRWIVNELMRLAIPTRQGNQTWARSSIAKILDQNIGVYTGHWAYLKYKSVEPKRRVNKEQYIRRPRSSRVMRDQADRIHIALDPSLVILSQDDAALIRQKQGDNRSKTSNAKNTYLLQYRLFCAKCNGLCYSDSFHQVPYYRCADKKRRFPLPAQCESGSIRAKTIESAVWESIVDMMMNPETLHTQAKQYFSDSKIVDVGVFDKKLKVLDTENERMMTAYREGLASLDDLRTQKKSIDEKRASILRSMKEAQAEQNSIKGISYESFVQDSSSFLKDFVEVLSNLSPEEKKQMLDWLSVKVHYDYEAKTYNIAGSLAVAQSCPQYVYAMASVVQKLNRATEQSKYTIPFTITGTIPQEIHKRSGIDRPRNSVNL